MSLHANISEQNYNHMKCTVHKRMHSNNDDCALKFFRFE